jgi:hypothetical protein
LGPNVQGHDGAASWDETDNIGKNAHMEVLRTRKEGETYIVTLDVTGEGFNGTSDIHFRVDGDRISSMVIAPD